MKKILLTSAVALAILSGCNNDIYEGKDIPGSKIEVSGSIDQLKTRVSDTEWTVGDAIGVSDNTGGANINIKYEAGATTGGFTSTTGIYILGSGDVTFTAYYPYAGIEGATAGTVDIALTDASGQYVGSSAVDYMFAEGAVANRENPQVNFLFTHKMSKLVLNITDTTEGDNAVAAGTAFSYVLEGVATDGTFNTEDGTVTANATTGNLTVDATLGTASSVILLPATSASQIRLVIKVGEKVFSGTFAPELAASYQYEYNIDLKSADKGEALKIDSPTINGWASGEGGDIELEEEEAEINYNEDGLEVGDFYCTDGTIIDNDYDLATLDEAVKKSIVGVVYYVGNPQPSALYGYDETADILKNDYPACTNGLAIALNNAQDIAERFATSRYSFDDWFKDENNTAAGSYIGTTLNITSVSDRMLGYNNTGVIEAAVAAVNDDTATGVANFITLLANYRTANVVAGASKWYLPSYAELKAVQDNYATISASIEKAGSTLPQYSEFGTVNSETFYWSSDLRGTSYSWVSPLTEVAEGTNLYVTRNSNGTKGFYRFAFAF